MKLGPAAGQVLLAAVGTAGMACAAEVPLRHHVSERDGAAALELYSGAERVGLAPRQSPCGVELQLPGAEPAAVRFRRPSARKASRIEFPVERRGPLLLRLVIEQRTPSLVERSVEVTALEPARFTLALSLFPAGGGEYASFTGAEAAPIVYDTLGGGPEYRDVKGQTFPAAMVRKADRVLGIVADSPGLWENRCLVRIDPAARRLAVLTGDGRDPYDLTIRYDARQKYRYRMDGWQHLAAGESRRYTAWLFAAPARSHYDAQLAAHVALANARGWNGSAVEAILRNTSYLLLRRNLMRDEGRYIFISGIGYGWKQWVSDGFWTALGHGDAEKTREACRSVFLDRITYEDNAQYYLIWSALVARAGGEPDRALVRQAYDFIRRHEHDGVYHPPRLENASVPTGFRTYMDLLPYADGDPPTSDQGFHCGALLAARELGLPATEEDVERAAAGYRAMFNARGGYMPTSLRQPELIGQDGLYGATLTYAVFGRKLLADADVLAHHRTSLATASPFGLRVISRADGSLLPGHSGAYVFGGSWFLCDAANYLLAQVHGVRAEEAERLLVERIARELTHVPAFHESISTATGKPHGHILYSWNSGYRWLRREIRRRLGQTGPDPVEAAIDARLGVTRARGYLASGGPRRLGPGAADAPGH